MSRITRAALLILGALALAYALRTSWRENERAAGYDFYIYFVNAQMAGREDIDNIYSPEVQERVGEEFYAQAQAGASEIHKYDAQRRRRLDSVSSPFLYTALGWISSDYDTALAQRLVVILAAFTAGMLLLGVALGMPLGSTLLLTAAILLWYRGFEADLRVGNVNSLQLFVVGWIALLDRRAERSGSHSWSVAAGALGGMMLVFKPTFLYAALLVLAASAFARQWDRLRAQLGGAAIGIATAIAAAAIHYGSIRIWSQWVSAANGFWHRLQTRDERNIAPGLELFQQYGTWISHALALLLIVAVCVALYRRGARPLEAIVPLSAGLLIYILSSTVVWLHYMVLVIPAAMILMRRGWWTALVALAALAAIAEEPFEKLTATAAQPIEVWLIAPSIAVLFALLLWAIRRWSGGRGRPRQLKNAA